MPTTGGPPPFSGLYLDDHSVQPARTPIQNELGFFCEWLSLRSTPAYYGWGLPHGRGEAVVVVPGFMGTDLSMMELYWWLARIGYEPYYSGLGLNVNCPDVASDVVLSVVKRAAEETGRPGPPDRSQSRRADRAKGRVPASRAGRPADLAGGAVQ